MRNVKLYNGMGDDFEIIRTNAPKEIIEENLRLWAEGETKFPYFYITSRGYKVTIITSSEESNYCVAYSEAYDITDY